MSDATQASNDLNLVSDSTGTGIGDIVFKAGAGANAVELARFRRGGGVTGALADPRWIRGNTCWAIGDSITAQSGVTSPLALAPDQYIAWAGILSNQRINITGYSGAAGNTTAQILSTQVPAVLALSPRPAMCLVLGGTNDFGAGLSVTQSAANLRSIYTQLFNAGIMPILCTLTPRSDFLAAIGKLNMWITRYALLNGLPFADLHGATVDPATGNFLAANNSGDNVHPNAVGAKAMGQAVATAIQAITPPWSPPLMNDNVDPNGMSNPLFLNSAAGLPTGWVLSQGAPTYAISTDPAVLGNTWQITRNAADVFLYGPAITAAAGDTIAFGGMVKAVPGATGSVTLECRSSDNSILFRPVTVFTQPFGWNRVYGEFVMPAGKINPQALVAVQALATANILLGQMVLYNLSALAIPLT